MIYWHVEKKSIVVHSPLISCAASEVAAMIDMIQDILAEPEWADVLAVV